MAARTQTGLSNFAWLLRTDTRAYEVGDTVQRLGQVLYADAPAYTPLPVCADAVDYVLFLDSGSRGNPGSGVSGSVLMRMDAAAREFAVVWVSSMSHADRCTTNNTSEYLDLLHGTRRARHAQCTPLHVVGDSMMIIAQQREH